MGRLIDTGLFLNNLSGRLESMKDYDAVKDVINNMPTAYDPGKAVEQLNICLQRTLDTLEYEMLNGSLKDRISEAAKVDAFQEAIEIVKGGGVDA